MTTYAVFGMARHRAVEAARRKVDTVIRDGINVTQISESEWEDRVQAAADETMKGHQIIQLSDRFDAPQFAKEFYDIAKRDGAVRLCIRAHTKRKRPDGTVMTNPKSGRPIMEWINIDPATI